MGIRKKRPDLVLVTWRDVLGTCGWEPESEAECPTFISVGYLIERGKDTVKIATTTDEKGEWFAFHAFPTGCITNIERIDASQIGAVRKKTQKERGEEAVGHLRESNRTETPQKEKKIRFNLGQYQTKVS